MVSTDNLRRWNWPSREEWGKQRRTCYADMENPLSPGDRVTDYASMAEIETAITELKTQWKRLGREMTEAKRIAGNLVQHPGETSGDYIQRWLKMTADAQDLASQPEFLRRDRKDINFVIREFYEAGWIGESTGWLSWNPRHHRCCVRSGLAMMTLAAEPIRLGPTKLHAPRLMMRPGRTN